MKNDLDAGDSRSSEGSGSATRPCPEGKGKTSERPRWSAEKHTHDSDPFITCSDGEGQNRRHHHVPTGCNPKYLVCRRRVAQEN